MVPQTSRTGQGLYDASKGMSARRAQRKASPLSKLSLMLVRLDHIASLTLDDLGASDFYLYVNPPCCLIAMDWTLI